MYKYTNCRPKGGQNSFMIMIAHTSQEALKRGMVLQMTCCKPRSRILISYSTIKIPPCAKNKSVEHYLNFVYLHRQRLHLYICLNLVNLRAATRYIIPL